MSNDEPFLTPEEASRFLDELGLPTAVTTLAKMRCVGGGPVFQNFGRWPRYKPSRLREYAASKLSRERRSTSDPRNASASTTPTSTSAPRRRAGRPRKVREDAASKLSGERRSNSEGRAPAPQAAAPSSGD